jgi:hypothetical protein
LLKVTGASGGAMNRAVFAAKQQRAQIASIGVNIDGLTGVHKRDIWLARSTVSESHGVASVQAAPKNAGYAVLVRTINGVYVKACF